ncbi:MAG: hypothetical protein WAV98_01990 [Minisyncoccia bacterium]
MENPIIRVTSEGIASPETENELAEVKNLRLKMIQIREETKNPKLRDFLQGAVVEADAFLKDLDKELGK